MTARFARFALVLLFALGACSSDEPPPDARPTCSFHSDCPNDGVCDRGQCFGTVSCLERKNCRNLEVCADDRCFCHPELNRCLPACETDNDCTADGHCLNGICERYPDEPMGTPPESGARGALRVGIGTTLLDFPMGVSMAGYGSRIGPRTPYQDSLGGSNSWFDRPDVRALAFDDGQEMFVLLRVPLSWTTDFLVAETTRKVAARTGVDLRGRIVTSAPHSHSQPARYWHLVVGLGFGFFGYGEWSREVFDRLTDSFSEAVVLAMEGMEPARLGYTVLNDFDPDNRIHRDRRSRNNNLPGYLKKDDRMLIIRVDDAAGDPLAVLVNFGIHGTIFGHTNPTLTADAGGGVEMAVTQGASAKYGRPVIGFFLQGNAGDISPGGDDKSHDGFEQMQLVGNRAWRVVEPALDGITTSSDVPVGVVTQRVPISHGHLGYGPGEYFDSNVSCDGAPDYFRYGAFQCVEGYLEDEDPATAFSDGNLACVFAVECLTDGHPVPQFQKTVLSVARLGTLALATMPGEPASQFGRDIASRIVEALPGTIADAAVLGYSQDHHFYLLNEDDWLQGGYEPSRDIWGWRLGPYLADHSVALARMLTTAPGDRVIDEENLKPMYWPLSEEDRRRVPFTESTGDPATILEDVPAEVERLAEVTLAWAGGHPGADLPHITLQVENAGTFEPYRRPGGLRYDDSGFEMIVVYEGRCNRSTCDDHRWRVRWQESAEFPLGRYRFQVAGRAFVNGEVVSYQFNSSAFSVVPSRSLFVYDARIEGGRLEGRVVEPPAVHLVPEGTGTKAEDAAFFLRSEDVPGRFGAPLSEGASLDVAGLVRAPGGAESALTGRITVERVMERRRRLTGYDAEGRPTFADDRDRPSTRFVVNSDAITNGPAGAYWVELSLTDPLGNAGTFTATITK